VVLSFILFCLNKFTQEFSLLGEKFLWVVVLKVS
jgi:hypothetical protein